MFMLCCKKLLFIKLVFLILHSEYSSTFDDKYAHKKKSESFKTIR